MVFTCCLKTFSPSSPTPRPNEPNPTENPFLRMYDDKLETAKDHICCGSCKKWNSHRRMITSGVVCFQTADEDGVIKTKYKKICARCWTAEKNLSTPKDEPKVSMMDAALKEHDSLYERQARKQVRRTTADVPSNSCLLNVLFRKCSPHLSGGWLSSPLLRYIYIYMCNQSYMI